MPDYLNCILFKKKLINRFNNCVNEGGKLILITTNNEFSVLNNCIMDSKLCIKELFIYFFVWIATNIYSLYKLYIVQEGFMNILSKELNDLEDLKPGWNFIGRLRDTSDIEWIIVKYYIRSSWWILILNFIISEIVRKTKISLLKYWFIISALLTGILHFGVLHILILLIQPILFCLLFVCGIGKTIIWMTSLILLISYDSMKYKHFFWYFLDRDDLMDEEVYLLLFAMPWITLRCISFSIDYIDNKNKQKEKADVDNGKSEKSLFENLVDMLSYTLYYPLLYMGPLVLYDEFEKSFTRAHTEPLSNRILRFTCDMIIFLFYMFIMDLSLHYIYFHALNRDTKLLQMFSNVALCGGGLWMGVIFHMKYVISYGTNSAFTRLDNIDAPPTPRCIARIHAYSQMWKYFDVGLYKFLVKYIYKPAYEKLTQYKLPASYNKLTASLLTFMFTFLWHGTERYILIWNLMNYLGVTMEYIVARISETESYKWFKTKVLRTEQMEIRFVALLSSPLLTMSAIANFYLFGGNNVGDCYFDRFVWNPSLQSCLGVLVILHCCSHVSIALKNVPSRTDVKIKKC